MEVNVVGCTVFLAFLVIVLVIVVLAVVVVLIVVGLWVVGIGGIGRWVVVDLWMALWDVL